MPAGIRGCVSSRGVCIWFFLSFFALFFLPLFPSFFRSFVLSSVFLFCLLFFFVPFFSSVSRPFVPLPFFRYLVLALSMSFFLSVFLSFSISPFRSSLSFFRSFSLGEIRPTFPPLPLLFLSSPPCFDPKLLPYQPNCLASCPAASPVEHDPGLVHAPAQTEALLPKPETLSHSLACAQPPNPGPTSGRAVAQAQDQSHVQDETSLLLLPLLP